MRLTASIRGSILKKLMEKTFGARGIALAAESKKLAIEFYDDACGGLDLSTFPEHFFNKETYLWISIDARTHYFEFDTERCVPNRRKRYKGTHALAKKFLKLNKKQEALSKDKRSVRRDANTLLDSVTTDGRLVEVWPEIKEVIPDIVAAAKMPMIPVGDLNRRIREFAKQP